MALPKLGQRPPQAVSELQTGLLVPKGLPRLPVQKHEVKAAILQGTMTADSEAALVLASLPKQLPETQEITELSVSAMDSFLSEYLLDIGDATLDPSQAAAVEGLIREQFGCLTGPAGSGKTFVTLNLLNALLKQITRTVNLKTYWDRGQPESDDDYDYGSISEGGVPAIAIACPTGKAAQQVKRRFPKSWWASIMTIHRMLGFYPEFFDDMNERGELVRKKRFVPAYDESNKMPWLTYVFDEAGMFDAITLWKQFRAACLPNARIFLIGDIQQLPPVQGAVSALGCGLHKWPKWELDTIHRQQGTRGTIIENSQRIIRGVPTVCDTKDLAREEFPDGLSFLDDASTGKTLAWLSRNQDWEFVKIKIDPTPGRAATHLHRVLQTLVNKNHDLYQPFRDSVITSGNGFNEEQAGFQLGQSPLNNRLVRTFNPIERCHIDAGRVTQDFSVGDKVMATVNNYETGVTNGMHGVIESINENGAYTAPRGLYGWPEEVQMRMAQTQESFDAEQLMNDVNNLLVSNPEDMDDKNERHGGPASHIVTVRFGDPTSASSFSVPFASKSEVGSLMFAYVLTCHKMQGSESDTVWTILHPSAPRLLTREWFYTACTRASRRQIVLYTSRAEAIALSKQVIKGHTLEQKVMNFARKPEILATFPNRCEWKGEY